MPLDRYLLLIILLLVTSICEHVTLGTDPKRAILRVSKPANRAVFLDRDGVLNKMVYRPSPGVWDSPYTLSELDLVIDAGSAIREIKRQGFLAIVVSNQPGVALGRCDLQFLDAIDGRIQSELAIHHTALDAIYYCPHHPAGNQTAYTLICSCRKPAPGLLIEAAVRHDVDLSRSYMVGDRLKDLQAGRAAGCRTILVTGSPVAPTASSVRAYADHIVHDIKEIPIQLKNSETLE